jgi:hypothetical protein
MISSFAIIGSMILKEDDSHALDITFLSLNSGTSMLNTDAAMPTW